jgi:hypothetical protein
VGNRELDWADRANLAAAHARFWSSRASHILVTTVFGLLFGKRSYLFISPKRLSLLHNVQHKLGEFSNFEALSNESEAVRQRERSNKNQLIAVPRQTGLIDFGVVVEL